MCFFQVWKNWQEGNATDIIDPILRNGSDTVREMIRCIHIGLLCIQGNVAARPTMASVMLMLNSSSLTLGLPSEPAFFMHSSIDPKVSVNSTVNDQSSKAKDKSSDYSLENASSTDLYPR